jgi:hypothetical protein
VIAMNSDVGATIGWPDLARTVASVYRPGAVIFTANYGEAGAVDRYGPALRLPDAYSGHNAFGYWGPPPDRPATVITLGVHPATLKYFRDCHLVARIGNSAGVDNDERGEPVERCAGPRAPWSILWTRLRHLG